MKEARSDYTPDDELEEMIRLGWGDMRREDIPIDWRSRRPSLEPSAYWKQTRPRLTRVLAPTGRPKGSRGIPWRPADQRRKQAQMEMRERLARAAGKEK